MQVAAWRTSGSSSGWLTFREESELDLQPQRQARVCPCPSTTRRSASGPTSFAPPAPAESGGCECMLLGRPARWENQPLAVQRSTPSVPFRDSAASLATEIHPPTTYHRVLMAGTGRPLILSHPPTGAHVVLEAPAELAGLAEHSREAFSAWLGGQTGSPLLLQRRTEAAEDSADDDESGRPAPGGAEADNLHSLYAPILTPFLEAADAHLDALASSDHAHASALYKDHGIRILQWLSEPRTTPPTAYLATCAVSLPLIGLFAADFSDPRPDAQVSLFNGPKAFVVTGHPRTLLGLVSLLKKSKADPGLDQSKVPFSKRLPVFSMRFLPIGVPYHSHHLEGCVARILRPVAEGGIGAEESEWWESHRASLGCPVYNTETGADLRAEPGGLLQTLADLICTRPVHWAQACAFPEDTTHIIDLGLGTLSGIGSLMARTTEGKGHRMVFAGLPASGEGNKTMNEVYDAINITREEKWSQKYKIGLIKTADGRLQIDTPFSRLLSKPPLMVAGMTPCTVPADFNAA
ncbi:hypothetical protein PtA15_8A192 [Puccinia triticina]|uniref:Uncharacterized protein n=1 Tax=Puccinia triticina TaxID=208348 RepID=A0ABY7CQS4_9BASI|nr:uncharacterized protein PtA15_8A192 [Puccinia triticina]WAQ87288.1 hypothetical protein PtA15_8A192 [Puccinia triticina]WAR57141.1 hypothetical protein PtB15_8B187 [Puccinia triticina]